MSRTFAEVSMINQAAAVATRNGTERSTLVLSRCPDGLALGIAGLSPMEAVQILIQAASGLMETMHFVPMAAPPELDPTPAPGGKLDA